MIKKTKWLLGTTASVLILAGIAYKFIVKKSQSTAPAKIYWFVPDGLRADPELFDIYKWAQDGDLPNLKKLIEQGSRGYSIPDFPGHTPTNFASLMTGTFPHKHGIADGAMRVPGYPLNKVVRGGFSSVSRKIPAIWSYTDQSGYKTSLLSVPGSTPPEMTHGVTVRGRWGGWGLDFPASVIHSALDKDLQKEMGINKRLFTFGSDLTSFVEATSAKDWPTDLKSYSSPLEIVVQQWGMNFYMLMVDSSDDNKTNYNQLVLSKDKKTVLATLSVGEWSDWIPTNLSWSLKSESKIEVPSAFRVKAIQLQDASHFRVRIVYDGLNEYTVEPSTAASKIHSELGPMIDFVDNYPPQLVYVPGDKATFLEEMNLSWDWHQRAVATFIKSLASDVVIHCVYNPNQMLTSRWWLPYVDPSSPLYGKVTEAERKEIWSDVKKMYQQMDRVLGEVLKNKDENTYVVLSSDHGALPLYKEIRLNNLFIKKGWLKADFDQKTLEYKIDWKKSKVIFLQMDNIYINPNGLDGNYTRASGAQYEKLREEVIRELSALSDEQGQKLIERVTPWEKAEEIHLPVDRVGDLVIANKPPYGFAEDIDGSFNLLSFSVKGGYKQGVIPAEHRGMWTPFVVMGPGIKENYQLRANMRHVDQFATLMKILKLKLPETVDGKVLEEIFQH